LCFVSRDFVLLSDYFILFIYSASKLQVCVY